MSKIEGFFFFFFFLSPCMCCLSECKSLVLVNLFDSSHSMSNMTAVWRMTIMKPIRNILIINQATILLTEEQADINSQDGLKKQGDISRVERKTMVTQTYF